MTIAAGPFEPNRFERRDSAGIVRWGGSLAIILALHAGLVLYFIAHPIAVEPPGTPPAAVMIDLAPLPVPQPEPVQPPPPQVAQPEPPPPPIPLPETPPPPVPPPPPKAVALPKPPPPPKPPKPRPVVERPPPPAPVPLPVTPAAPPPVTAPAAPPQPSAAAVAGAKANWQAQIVGWLARYKRYPRVAEEQHQEGTAYIRFTMDRSGHVLSSQLERSSGFSLLDEEVVALIQRAQPLPALPAEVSGITIQLVVPIAFTVRAR